MEETKDQDGSMMSDDNDKQAVKFRDMRAYPIVYMFVVTFAAAGVLIGLGHATAARVETNREMFFERAVLSAVDQDEVLALSPARVHELFMETIRTPSASSAGAYRLVAGGPSAVPGMDEVKIFALPFEGQGFWNEIRGILGISPDGMTVVGLAFYEQSETPGLGAEIVKPYFTDQFRGLSLRAGDPALRLKVAGSGGAAGVDAVTGATRTCGRLEGILNEAIARWRSERGDE